MDPAPAARDLVRAMRRSSTMLSVLVLCAAACAAPNERVGPRVRLPDGGAASDAGHPSLPPRDEPLDPLDAGAPPDPAPAPAPDPAPDPDPDPAPDPAPDPCMGVDYLGRCDGDVAVWCGRDGTLRSRDCADYGMTCAWIDAATGYYCTDAALPPAPDAGVAPPPALDAGTATPPPSDAGTAPPPAIAPLRCRDWAEQHTASGSSWGAVLTDIVRHLPRSYGDTYYDADHVTYGHETSHGIHAHIRNYLNDTGARANGFYLPGGRACLVREPSIRKSDAATYIPTTLRWSRYSTYVSGARDWDDTPLYLWDEWNAYVNGAEVGLDRYRAGLWRTGWRGTVDGVIEFVVYGVAIAMAAEARDPGWLTREPNALAFLAHELDRSMTAFRAGQTIPVMQWAEQDAYYERLRTSSDAAAMRDWIRGHFGAEWTTRVMGF